MITTRTIKTVAASMSISAVLTTGLGFLYIARAGAEPVQPPPAPAQVCEEDQPCWDCTTMGNRICGPVALVAFTAPLPLGPQDDVLCSSNMAYRNGHKAECRDIAINSHGGGGGWGAKDSDGDGTSNADDPAPRDPDVK